MPFNYDELTALTREYFLPTLTDQIFSKDVILAKLKDGKKTVDGGRSFDVPIKVDTLNRGKFAANSTFDVAKKEIANKVSLPVRGHYANLTIDSYDEAINSGNEAVIKLMSEKVKDLEEAMRQELLEALYDDPATVDPSNQGFIGLQSIVSASNIYAGLDRSQAEFDYWRSIVKEDTTGTNPITLDYATLRDFYMNVTNGGQSARNTVFVGDYSTVNAIENILSSRNQISTLNETQANLGFENFTLFGKPVHASSHLEKQAQTAGKGILYALNFDYLSLWTMKGNDFRLTGFKGDRNSELKSNQLIVMGNFVNTKPQTCGKIKDIAI